MIKKLAFLSAAAMSIAFAVPAQAQWTGFTADNNGPEYWNNLSDDGTRCNIGFVVTGVAGTADSPCVNQRPAGWLPFTNTTPAYDLYEATPLFFYQGGSIQIQQAAGQGGDIAGQDRAWGYWSSGLVLGGAKVLTDVNSGSFPAGHGFADGEYWGLWVSTTDGVNRFSDTDNQFARFARSSGCASAVCGPLMVGIEDHNTLEGGDRDYQDMIASITLVGIDLQTVTPEPSTYALMAAGLAALGMAARRRRNV